MKGLLAVGLIVLILGIISFVVPFPHARPITNYAPVMPM